MPTFNNALQTMSWKIGDRVYVTGYENEGARTIAALYGELGDEVRLDKPVCGLRYWALKDLKPAPRSSL